MRPVGRRGRLTLVAVVAGPGLVRDLGREPVLHRVLEQLGDHDGQRSGYVGRQLPGVAFGPEAHRLAQGVGGVLRHADQRPDDLLEGHLLAGVAGQDLMDDGDGADLPLDVVQGGAAHAGVEAPGPQAEQGRDRLQVVLDAVVDLPDGRVLRDQEPVPPAQVGHVTDQAQGPGGLPLVEQGDAAQAEHDVVATFDLLVHGQGGDEGPLYSGLLHAQLVEPQPLGVGGDAHAVEGADGVGRGVLDPRPLVEDEHAVAHARRLLGGDVLTQERELAVDDHAGETVEDVDVDALQLTRATPDGERRLTGQHGQQLAAEAHRDALAPGPFPPPAYAGLAIDDLSQAPGPAHQRALDLVDHLPDQVLPVQRLARRGTHLADHREPRARLVGEGNEQEKVGDAQVGEHSPRRHQALEVRLARVGDDHDAHLFRGPPAAGCGRGRR